MIKIITFNNTKTKRKVILIVKMEGMGLNGIKKKPKLPLFPYITFYQHYEKTVASLENWPSIESSLCRLKDNYQMFGKGGSSQETLNLEISSRHKPELGLLKLTIKPREIIITDCLVCLELEQWLAVRGGEN
jgi:hypothetical protein